MNVQDKNPHLKLLAFAGLMFCAHQLASAQTGSTIPFGEVLVRALIDGKASSALPETPLFSRAIAALKAQADDSGPLAVQAVRITRFEQQPRCGRVAFEIAQPSSRKAWPALGAQLNICEDGLPPLQVCAEAPNILVPSATKCRNGAGSVDTAEVAAAIRAAIAQGGTMTPPTQKASGGTTRVVGEPAK